MLIFGSVAGAHKQATNGAETQATKRISIQDFRFSPAKITVKAGTKVIWVNEDSVPHTVTGNGAGGGASANNGAFDSGTLRPGERFSHTFRKAGTFAYHCEIHPEMQGSVTVKLQR
jgi:plastocyanin